MMQDIPGSRVAVDFQGSFGRHQTKPTKVRRASTGAILWSDAELQVTSRLPCFGLAHHCPIALGSEGGILTSSVAAAALEDAQSLLSPALRSLYASNKLPARSALLLALSWFGLLGFLLVQKLARR